MNGRGRRWGLTAAAAAVAIGLAGAVGSLRAGGDAAAVDSQETAEAASAGDVYAWLAGRLSRVDPITLARRGPAVRIELDAAAFSPDRTRLAVAAPNTGRVRIVDLRGMRAAGPGIDVGFNVNVDTMQWLDGRTLVAVTWGEPKLLFVDVPERRVVRRSRLPGVVFARATTRDALVLLLGPADRVGASTLVVVDRAHGVRTTRLAEIRSGYEAAGGAEGVHRRIAPGLALDPDGRRAVVVPPAGRVADVDLATLSVAYHELSQRASVLGRLRDRLEPAARAKSVVGPERHAFWVGDQTVAVVAVEQAGIHARGGEHRQLARAEGVELIDTRSWTVRALAAGAGGAAAAGGTVLVYGGAFSSGAPFSAGDGPPVLGVRAFGAGGEERFSLLPGRHIGHVTVAGAHAYAAGAGGRIDVVDVRTGRVVRTVRGMDRLLLLAP